MKQIEHRLFLEKNKIDKKLLLEPIQKKMDVFDSMYKLLGSISSCGKNDLEKQLRKLDNEIIKDIEDVYADDLSNNEIKEIKVEHEAKKKKTVAKKLVKNTDEFVIEQIVETGNTKNIGRSTFIELGLKTKLEWLTIIGKYRIKRINIFSYRYDVYEID